MKAAIAQLASLVSGGNLSSAASTRVRPEMRCKSNPRLMCPTGRMLFVRQKKLKKAGVATHTNLIIIRDRGAVHQYREDANDRLKMFEEFVWGRWRRDRPVSWRQGRASGR